MTLWSFSTGSSLPVCYSVLANALSISESDTSGGNVSEMEGTKGYTTSPATSGYTFQTGDLVSIGIKGDGSTSSRSTTEVIKQYTVAAGTGTQALTYSKDAGGPTEYAAGGKLINITIGSETFSYEVPAGGITLAAGKQYNYNITVKNQTINVETVITDWNDVADAHTSYIPPAERLPPMPASSKTVNTIKQPILFTSTTQG